MRSRIIVFTLIAFLLLPACRNNSSSSSQRDDSVIIAEIDSLCTDLRAPELGQGTLCIDNGFRVARDDFSFANWGRSQSADSNVTIQTLIDLFGHNSVCLPGNTSTCILRPTTQQTLESWNNALSGGRCEGLATMSARFFLNMDDPVSFRASSSRVSDLRRDDAALNQAIVYWWSTQFLPEVADRAATSRTHSPLTITNNLIQGLAHGLGYTIGLYFGSSGHSLTPFAVTRRSKNYVIHVYDNNYPGQRREITIDSSDNSWRYPNAIVGPDGVATDWNGSTGTLELTPMSARQGPFTCPFCETSPQSGPTVLTLASRDAASPGFIRITTRNNGIIEATPTSITNTITGSVYTVNKGINSSLITVQIPSTIGDIDIEVRRATQEVPSADVVLGVRRPGMASVQISGNLASTVIGSKSDGDAILAVRRDAIKITAPAQEVARVTIAAGQQLSRHTLTDGNSLIVNSLSRSSIEVSLKGRSDELIGSTLIDARESTLASLITLSINEEGKLTADAAVVQPLQVQQQRISSFVARKTPPPTTTTTSTTISVPSIEVSRPG